MVQVKCCSLKYAPKLLATGKFTACISIGHPNGTEHVEGPCPRLRLNLNVADVTPFRGTMRPLFTAEQCMELIDFARALPADANVLIHCKQGRSRSTAAMLILLVALKIAESVAIKLLLAETPKANPNGWMLRVADAILGTKLFGTCKKAGCLKWALTREVSDENIDAGDEQ